MEIRLSPNEVPKFILLEPQNKAKNKLLKNLYRDIHNHPSSKKLLITALKQVGVSKLNVDINDLDDQSGSPEAEFHNDGRIILEKLSPYSQKRSCLLTALAMACLAPKFLNYEKEIKKAAQMIAQEELYSEPNVEAYTRQNVKFDYESFLTTRKVMEENGWEDMSSGDIPAKVSFEEYYKSYIPHSDKQLYRDEYKNKLQFYSTK